MFQTDVMQKIETHSIGFLRISYRLRREGGQAQYENMVHAHCMLDYLDTNIISDCVIFTAFPRQKWLQELTQTQAHSEGKKTVQTQRPYCSKLY